MEPLHKKCRLLRPRRRCKQTSRTATNHRKDVSAVGERTHNALSDVQMRTDSSSDSSQPSRRQG
jgi:hypothetical protein